MNNLQKLTQVFVQSPWLDNLSRDLIDNGGLQAYVDQGVRGVTTNPTILENAIAKSDTYTAQIKQLAAEGLDAREIYWRIVEDDVKRATDILRPVWEQSGHLDGYVSIEVSPDLATDANATLAQAKKIWATLDAPNLMIKVPAVDESLPAIAELLKEGINVNATLIFSLDHYKKVAAAHRASHNVGDPNKSRSVASFFISRVDSEVDKRLEAIGTEAALNLRGQAAVAQAHIAYKLFLEVFGDAAVLEANSPAVQRLLWASTSTKNESYDDLLYVRYLVAPHTVNTLPEDTIGRIIDHLSEETRSLNLVDIENAESYMKKLAAVGVDIDDVSATLESEGVQKFQASFASLLKTIEDRIAS